MADNEQTDDRLKNPFAQPANDSPGFLAFTASTPSHDNFQPRRGEMDGRGNWERFGQQFGGSPSRGHRQPFRGSPGGFRGSPGGFRGSPGGFRGGEPVPHFYQSSGGGARGGFQSPFKDRQRFGSPHKDQRFRGRGGGGNFVGPPGSYFHPSMLEDPWAMLVDPKAPNNDSMIPQVGDSILDRDYSDDSFNTGEDSINRLVNQRINPAPDFGSDDSGKTDPGALDGSVKINPAPDDGDFDRPPAQSDSMIPAVGDSILQRTISDDDGNASRVVNDSMDESVIAHTGHSSEDEAKGELEN